MPDPNPHAESAPSATALPVERLGDFRIVREIGRGGMGVVYEAEDVNLGRRVALKLLTQRMLRDANQRRRFEREAKSAAKLHHTNIVPVFGFGEADGTPYYAMQFIEGAGLDAVVAEVARLSSAPPAAPPSREHGAVAAARSLVTGAFDRADEEPAAVDEFAATNTFALPAGAELPVPETGTLVPDGAATRAVPTADTSAVLSGMTSSATIPGHTASGIGRRLRKLTYWQGVARIGAQIADALDYAHRQGIVHRDVKPSNLLLDATGTVWVTDFGLAKADGGDNLTHTGDILGTLRYMPPEAFEGKADERSDVYALGLTLYELLALRPAFDEPDRNKLIKMVTQSEPVRLRKVRPDVPRDLETIVHKAIDRDPAHRYQKAADLAADLQRFLDDEPIKARRQSAAEAAWRWARRHKLEAALAALVGVVLVAATVASLVLAAHFRHQEYVQRRAADERAALAEHNRKLADDNEAARRTAEGALEQSRQSQRDLNLTLADMYTLQGLQAGPTGRHREAPLWFAKAAEVGAADPHRVWTNRVRAQAWAAELARPVAAHAHVGNVPRNLTFHPSGRYLLADAPPGTPTRPVILDIETNRLLDFPDGKPVSAAVWSPDGSRVALSAAGGVAVYRFPEMDSREQVGSGTPLLLRFSANGNLLALAGDSGVAIWDRQAKALVGAPRAHPAGVQTVEFTTDGERLVTADAAGTFRVFRVRGALELSGPHVTAGTGWTTTGPILAAGNRLITASSPRELTIRTLGATTPPRALQLTINLAAIERSADGTLCFAHGEQNGTVFRADTAERVLSVNDGGLCAAFHPDGRGLVFGGGNPKFHHRSIPAGKSLPALATEATGYRAMRFSPGGQYLATVGYEGQIRVWELPQPDPADFAVPTDKSSPGYGTFSADSQFVLISSHANPAQLYDARTGRPVGGPIGPQVGTVRHAGLTADGRTVVLAVALPDGHGRVEFRDSATGTTRFAALALPDVPEALALSPTGARAAVLCARGRLVVLDPTTGQQVTAEDTGIEHGRLRFSGGGRVFAVFGEVAVLLVDATSGRARFPAQVHRDRPHVALSRDGKLLATAGTQRVLRVWDTATGEQVGPNMLHPSWIDNGVVFHPDGTHLATGGKDAIARIWEVRTGRQIAEFEFHGGAAAFTPDGRVLVTASSLGAVDAWDWRNGTRVLPSRALPIERDTGWNSGYRKICLSPDGTRAVVGGRPSVHVVSLAALYPTAEWTDRDLGDWGELLAHQRFDTNAPANLRGDEWLAKWRAFRARHPDRLPGDTAPANPATVAARLSDAGRWADAARVVRELLERAPTDHEVVALATDVLRKVARARQAGAALPPLAVTAARPACENALAAHPDRTDLAALLADLLLEAREPVEWHVLRPVALDAASGAPLTVQPDGSILAGGKAPERDSYAIEVDVPVAATALRLEGLPDPSLPFNGPGRDKGGNFHLTELALAAGPPGAETAVPLVRASSTFRDRLRDFNTSLRDGPHGAIDGTHTTRWDVYQHTGKPQSLTVDLGAPVRGRIVVRIECRDPVHAQSLVLGRFRLSVTDRPDVARAENLIALGERGNGWTRLGIARAVRGEWAGAIGPLERATADPAAAFDAYLLLALVHERLGHPVRADLNFDAALKRSRTVDALVLEVGFDVIGPRIVREPENAELLFRRFRWHATMGRTTAAVADLNRARALRPDRAFDQNEVLALRTLAADAAARGEWTTARGALERLPGPLDVYALSHLALVRARLGDPDGHRRACAELLERFGATSAPYTACLIARAWGARPVVGAPARVGELAALAGGVEPSAAHALGYQVRALAEYRAGRFAAVEEWCAKCDAAKPTADVRACADALRAMALFRLGRADEARRLFGATAARTVPPGARPPYAAHEWLMVDLLRHEAEALLVVPVAPPPRG